jgi:ADP-heptose:LPS heptosyltransferase
MTPSRSELATANPELTPTVIIAYRGPGSHLEASFLDLKVWFKNIVVVGPENFHISQFVKNNGGSWVVSDSLQIAQLWEEGIKSKLSDWYILIQNTEYLSTVLKESIIEVVQTKHINLKFYPFDRKVLFLKQRLKYNLNWAGDFASGLLFQPTLSTTFLETHFNFLKTDCLEGDLIHFGEKTLNEAIQNSIYRADWLADQFYKNNSYLSKQKLVVGAIKYSLKKFFTTWIIRKGIREGYEGLVFCFLEAAVVLFSYLRYYEKYIRSGKQIENNLENINKVLIIKLRGLGDGVIATTTIKNIKQLLPRVLVSTLTFNFCKPIFENNPYLENIYGISGEPEKKELKKLLDHLNQENFDLIINLHARSFSTKIAKKIKARWKINRSYFLREKYSDVLIGSDHALDRTSIERDLDCLRAISLNPTDKKPEIFITNDEIKWAEGFMAQKKIDPSKRLIIIHPSSSQDYRNWGMERFVELSRLLIKNHGYQILGCFSEKEQTIAKSLHDQVKGVFIHAGPLRKSIALIYKADLMIDNASGPSHISSALNIPTIVLMGPQDYKNTYYDEDVHKENSFFFYRDVRCRDLLMSKCLPPNPCQNRVCQDYSVEEVYKKAQELLI